MARFIGPILAAWLTLWIGLHYLHNNGLHDLDHERQSDWYLGYAEMLVTDGKYQDCTPEPTTYHCASPLPARAYRLPGYPLFLAGILLIAPDHPVALARLLQMVLLALVVYMASALAYRLYPQAVGYILPLLALGVAQSYYYASFLYTETLFTFVLMVYIYAHLYRPRYAGWVWGASLLIRTSLLFATPLLIPLQARRRRLIFILAVLVVCSSLWLRNSLVLNEVVFFGTNGGTVLKAGHNEVSYQTGEHVAPQVQPDWPKYAGLSEVALDQALTRDALEYAIHHNWLRASWAKIRQTWGVVGALWLCLNVVSYGLQWHLRRVQPVTASYFLGRNVLERR